MERLVGYAAIVKSGVVPANITCSGVADGTIRTAPTNRRKRENRIVLTLKNYTQSLHGSEPFGIKAFCLQAKYTHYKSAHLDDEDSHVFG